MPIEKKSEGCFHVHNTTTKKCLSKEGAKKQLAAIEISKNMNEGAQKILYKGYIFEAVKVNNSIKEYAMAIMKKIFNKDYSTYEEQPQERQVILSSRAYIVIKNLITTYSPMFRVDGVVDRRKVYNTIKNIISSGKQT